MQLIIKMLNVIAHIITYIFSNIPRSVKIRNNIWAQGTCDFYTEIHAGKYMDAESCNEQQSHYLEQS